MSLVCETHETGQCMCKCKFRSTHACCVITAHNAGHLQLQITGIVSTYIIDKYSDQLLHTALRSAQDGLAPLQLALVVNFPVN